MNISVFIHKMHIPVLLYKCCDAKKQPHGSPIQAFLNRKQSFILMCLLLADIFQFS